MLLDSPTHSICQIGLQDSALALSEEVFDASFCSSISRTSKSSYRLARVQNRKKKDSVIITYVLYSKCVVRNSGFFCLESILLTCTDLYIRE